MKKKKVGSWILTAGVAILGWELLQKLIFHGPGVRGMAGGGRHREMAMQAWGSRPRGGVHSMGHLPIWAEVLLLIAFVGLAGWAFIRYRNRKNKTAAVPAAGSTTAYTSYVDVRQPDAGIVLDQWEQQQTRKEDK
ncbi:hypothetical protein ACVNS2_34905 [Paenibacillus caseinilyticus]|uniref:Uncharacterized protein n=1 Tax=Paenibacillus mucilaginosus K02 TaxID=997761 RepID=I0BU50_9BACL|nr:hypothetical protein [Paenibacillus mucilaginosus]AFH65897.1 hypothetical protein B2K_35230 [Paenibacillus mucilaginosus K02]